MTLKLAILLGVLTALSMFGSPDRANAAGWASCAGEGGDCTMSSNGRNLVRYGTDDKFFMMEFSGIDRVHCGGDVFGDPAVGQGKHCDYRANPSPVETWKGCVSEGKICKLPDNTPRRVRYGGANHWVLKIESGSVPCDNDHFPDVAPGVAKSCQYAAAAFKLNTATTSSFSDCGSEGQDCAADTGIDVALFRFGRDPAWEYRLGIASSLHCGNDAFRVDRAYGQGKFCQYAAVAPNIAGVFARWKLVTSCQGTCSLSKSIQTGVSGTRSTTRTETWSQELSTTIEESSEVTIPGGKVGEKVSVTAKAGHSTAVAVADSLTHSVVDTTTAQCPSALNIQMFQFGIDVDELCFARDGQCASTVSTASYLCAVNKPAGFAPICAPGNCKDDMCTQCAN